MWKPLQMMPAPDGYRVAVFSEIHPSDAEPYVSASVCPVVALVLAEYEPDPGEPRDAEPGERRVTFAYVRSGDWYGTLAADTELLVNSRFAVQLLAPGEEPNLEVGRDELAGQQAAAKIRHNRQN
jgi:hypothetical protein